MKKKAKKKPVKGKTKTIKVDYLARVEGEGALYIRLQGEEVADVKLKIFEPPRFFEAFLRGRDFREAPDITSRICGICPVAYQMSAAHAMEAALGLSVQGPLRELRRLLYCGEWIESHTLHIYMLHAPDFLGYPDAIRMAKDFPEIVQRGLRLKKVGNEIMTRVGGREVHPINVRVGGFYRAPKLEELRELLEPLKWAREAALETLRWVAGFQFPRFERNYTFVSLRHAEEYPLNEGRIVSNRGLDIPASEFEAHFVEEHVPYSNALHCVLKDSGAYFVGPMARYNLNFDKFPTSVREAARSVGMGPEERNPFKSILVRSVEVLYACHEALRIIENYRTPAEDFVESTAREAEGHACTEAPRGILYHRYRLNASGAIEEAKIVPPTSQNQKTIEADLWKFIPPYIRLPEAELQDYCEQAVRNYDPCISCATHFLKLKVERG